ncbi:MAG: NAD(P)/FAD-dependent oxidoreductase [Haloferacaceae archaeon]
MTGESETRREYEVVVVGGGPAGLTAALYTTRLGHETAVVDRGGGRAAMMLETHNVIGVPEDVSGNEFLETARRQVEAYGCDRHTDLVTAAERLDDGRVRLDGADATYVAERVVLATGFTDRRADPPLPRTGRGLHYCLHCDAYMFVDEPVYVMGHSDAAAHVAMIMLNYTADVDLLTRGAAPEWSEETADLLAAHPVDVIETDVDGLRKRDDGWLEAFEFADGSVREYKGGFAMYGSDYNTDLAADLGCDLNADGTIAVDDHGRTSVDGVLAVGDVTPGHNQIPVAMGQGAQAGIAVHMDLRAFPRDLDRIREEGPVAPEEVPGMDADLRATARAYNRGEDAPEASADD